MEPWINEPGWTNGVSVKAISFDGNDDRIDCGSGSELDIGTSDFSFSAWVNMGYNQNTYSTLVAKGGGASYDEGYWINIVNHRLRFYLSDGTTRLVKVSDAVSIFENNWYHIVITVDRDQDVTFYVDGENAGVRDISEMDGENITSSKTFTIGSWMTNPNACFTGTLDDVRVYDMALTPTEVGILYDLYSANKSAPVANNEPGYDGLNMDVYPNPFNDAVNIAFSLNEDKDVKIAVYNINGELIRAFDEGMMPRGRHLVRWNGQTIYNNSAPKGMYVVRIITTNSTDQKSLIKTR